MGGIRIIGGRFRGKRLATPADRSVRPTGERTREALFDILDSAGLIAGATVLDLFCGTGAVGLEAWSRGAGEVWLIDRDVTLAKANVEALGRPDAVHIRRADASALGAPPARFDLAFLDPPYRSGLAATALAALGRGWLAEDATIVVELAAREALEPPMGFTMTQDRRYGAARLVFLEHEKPEAGPS
ncbi:MAG: 16S rRNA (guanine(966)-N(2))-methyltransferase RsmD [Alphaproteobacteria bacterium]